MLDFRRSLELGEFSKAQDKLDKSVLKTDTNSKLLWHLEKGSLFLVQKDFDQAIEHLLESQRMIDEFYTIRLSKVAKSYLPFIGGEEFKGAGYERSLTYYYLSRAYYEKFLATGVRANLFSARAVILAWDSYFQALAREGYKSLYRTDLLLKVFGAQIHEQIDSRNDQQIALQLYKDAVNMAPHFGGVFQYFNSTSKEFIAASESARGNKNFSPTVGYQDFLDFLHYKILSLTYDLRRYEFDKMVKTLKASAEIVNRAKKVSNVSILVEEGYVARKVPRVFNFGLKGAMDKIEDPKTKEAFRKHGAPIMGAFAMNVLGLYPKKADVGGVIFAHQVASLAATELAIQFEMPMMEETTPLKQLQLYVMDEQDKVVETRVLPLISQTSDLARLVLEEEAVWMYVEKGTRVALKHLTAIAAAYVLYQQIKTPENDFLARTLALGSYVAAAKGIAYSEVADTRQWISLADGIRMQEFTLAAGKYRLGIGSTVKGIEAKPSKILGEIEVTKNKQLFTFRL